MTNDSLGQILALSAAITWASALVLFKKCGERMPPLTLNLFKNTVGIVLLAATLPFTGDISATFAGFAVRDILILVLSGLLGIALADTVFFYGLNLVGVGIISIVDCLYSPFVILFAFLLLGEKLTMFHYVGGAMIVFGVLMTSKLQPPEGKTRAQLVAGILLGVLALALMAIGIVIAKPVLERFPLIWAVFIRMIVGTILLGAFAMALPSRHTVWAAFRPSGLWKISMPGAVLGAYLAMVFWVGGFKYTSASIAGILNQMSIIFAIVFASLFLKERFTRRKLLAVILAASGVILVTVGEGLWGRMLS